jgi:UDP-2,3-diacylglucosamine pyrophosphatase LpxH
MSSGPNRPQFPWLQEEPRPQGWDEAQKRPLVTYGIWMPRKPAEPTKVPQRNARANKQQVVSDESDSFIFLDVGCWLDNALGGGERRRNFGIICGPHAFVCEFNRSKIVPIGVVSPVQRLFDQMKIQGCGVKINQYLLMNTTRAMTDTSTIWLFLGDTHLPRAGMYYSQNELSALNVIYEPPDWLAALMAKHPETEQLQRNYYSCAEMYRRSGNYYPAHGPLLDGVIDIFGKAGDDLVFFLNALCNIDASVQKIINFIQVGDLVELMLGLDDQFEHGPDHPVWRNTKSPDWVYDWIVQVMIQNTPVFEALRRVNRCLASCQYVWGNHDCYFLDVSIAGALGLPSRQPYLQAMDNKLFVEHGHRFDEFTFDNKSSGNLKMDIAYFVPSARRWWETISSKIYGQNERQWYIDGATQTFRQNNIAAYVMAHTHTSDIQLIDVSEDTQL